ncbi:hypothetical protein [uncultured Nocardioides sp.]|uniref:Uncharacterized protein n=1 Tax=uncultured Nocardioides sp. TaxID=198441 RepID=A0A6J4PMX4_9ACTN|nr:hypothetical protein [uncultured Nocardioides sp.]CAA9419179.1 MAG: hypothetical protein AVDCRST_MAG06-3407 [uncultured Nocardioides sp.]
MTHGVSFAALPDGRRSTSRVGRQVVADALRGVDPVGARAAEQETAWRSGYLLHFRRLVEAGLATPDAWLAIAGAGLDSVHRNLVVAGDESDDRPLDSLLEAGGTRGLRTAEVTGEGQRQEELVVPYRGRRLHGAGLRDQLLEWARRGVLEPSVVDAVSEVAAHPERLRLDGHTVAVLGAGAEMGPLAPLLGWGATVAAVDLPRPAVWERVLRAGRAGAGRLLVPVAEGAGDPRDDVGRAAGADLLAEVPEVADWLAGLDGRLVVGNYLYADGATHVRVSVAADVLGARVSRARPETALAFLATPTDVFVVPRDAVEQSTRAYVDRSGTAKLVGRPLRWASRGRLLHRAYPPAADPGIADSLVPVQGPNYALAKRVQRWRAAVARGDGRAVSLHVAPSTRTRSVVKNRALAAAFAGAHRFGVEIFEPETSNILMAALLVHDLTADVPPHEHPWQDEAHAAVHGGLWRAAYEPRSALGLAAVLGYGSARG